MFIKTIPKTDKKTKKRYYYYRLTESYRIGDKPRHRTILNLGRLEELPHKEDHKILADRIEEIILGQKPLFCYWNETVERLAQHYAKIIINQRLVDISPDRGSKKEEEELEVTDYQQVDINSLSHPWCKEIGGEWLCKQTLDRLGLEEYLRTFGWKKQWIKRAMIYLIAKALFPSSEHKTEDWLRRNTGVSELYNISPDKISRHHLSRVSKMLYEKREVIDSYLREKAGELFRARDKILIYDLTNTYFEGVKIGSKKACYGRSKEMRKDAKILSLALVVDTYGFIKCSRIYEGNIRESKTLKRTIEDMKKGGGNKECKEVIVIDAGIATEENLRLLREEGYEYVSVSLSRPKEWEEEGEGVKIEDKEGNNIFVQWVKVEGKEDNFLYVKSKKKGMKDQSKDELHCQRYEEGLRAIQEGIEKKGGVKRVEKVYERLGRLKERYPSVHRFYEVSLKSEDEIVKQLSWEKRGDEIEKRGVYFIRTTFKDKDEKTVWDIYNTIREIEATFRTLKTDLRVRPIFHQGDFASEAHIYGSILAYSIVNSIRHSLKAKGIHYDWSNIVRLMHTQKIVITSMKTKSGHVIYVKKCTHPEKEVKEIYELLAYKDRPFWQKKSVLPENKNSNSQPLDST